MKKLFMFTLLMVVSFFAFAGNHLNGEQLKAVLVGSTESGVYTNKGEQLKYVEFYRPDGKIKATEDKYGPYVGAYTIKPDGCFDADYDGDEFDGCYYYEPMSDNQYKITSPQGATSTVTITKGDTKNLNK